MDQAPSRQDEVARLFDEHAARAFRYARAMGLSRADADDVVAETFLRVLRSCASFRGEGDPSTWLFRIVRNQVLDTARGESRRRARHEAVSEHTARAPAPDEHAQQREMRAAVGDALASLDPGERTALSLVTAGGLSYREAAAVEAISPSALASRVFRARRVVLRHLVERGLVPQGGEH